MPPLESLSILKNWVQGGGRLLLGEVQLLRWMQHIRNHESVDENRAGARLAPRGHLLVFTIPWQGQNSLR